MTTVLIVDDDAATRSQVGGLLRQHGYAVVQAVDGAAALALLRAGGIDAVVSDVGMPGLDGFQLVEAIRGEPALAPIPVLLLTALGDRGSMRRGMTAGADDFLAKPAAAAELLEALAGILRKRERVAHGIELAVRERVALLGQAAARGEEYGLAPAAGAVVDRRAQATVLFADIRNFTALAEQLGSAEAAALLAAYYEHACQPVLARGGVHLKFIGDGLLSLFVDGAEHEPLPAARRAVAAALGLTLATHEFRPWVQRRFPGLPPFAIGIGLHAGEVSLCRLEAGERVEVTPIGDTVNVAARLESASKELGWTVVASRAVLERAGPGVQTGGTAALALRGRSEDIEVHEVTGLAAERGAPGACVPLDARAGALRTAVTVNSALAAAAPDGSPVTVVGGPQERRDG